MAVIGVLANQKGAVTVMSVASAADPAELSIHVIGYAEQELPAALAERIAITGEYAEADLPALLAKVKPHVVWFPAQWPETYSYTLSAAIDAGLPIVATRIGAFPERLEGRPLTWLVDPEASTEEWLRGVRQGARRTGARRASCRSGKPRKPVADFYRDQYVRPSAVRFPDQPVDLRRDDRISVVVIPERFPGGALTPCAYIRLLQPLDHPAIGGDCDIVLADADEALRYRADIIVTQRYAVPDLDAADALIRHCREHDITLLYDLDDDLRHIPRDHPDAGAAASAGAAGVAPDPRRRCGVGIDPGARRDAGGIARRCARGARMVSTSGCGPRCRHRPPRQGPVRILFMGTATHDADFAIVEARAGAD